MLIKKIAILGGTGFVGQSLCNRLSEDGYELKVPTRNREYNREDLILLPNLELIETDIHNPKNLKNLLVDCDSVINLIGILNEKENNGKGFKKVMASLKNLEQDVEKPFREVIVGGAQLIRGEAIKSIQSGPKSGRIYEKYNPRRTHRASAPGQAPASDTGNLVRNIVVKQENPDLVKVQ